MVPADAGYDIVLGTRRLVLRRLVLDDLDALAAIQRDPEVVRFLGGPRTRARSRQTLGWILVQKVDGETEHETAYLLGGSGGERGTPPRRRPPSATTPGRRSDSAG